MWGINVDLNRIETMAREDFSQSIKFVIGARVAFRCSNPSCRRQTTGPSKDVGRRICIGAAAHIIAASSLGPRSSNGSAKKNRRLFENGIWLCQACHALVDSDPKRFTIKVLKSWKKTAEAQALQALSSAEMMNNLYDSRMVDRTPNNWWNPHALWDPRSLRLGLETGLLVQQKRKIAFSDRFIEVMCAHGRDWASLEIDEFLANGLPVLLLVAAARSTCDPEGTIPLYEDDATYLLSKVPISAAIYLVKIGADLGIFSLRDDEYAVEQSIIEEFCQTIGIRAADFDSRKQVRPIVINLLHRLVEARVLIRSPSKQPFGAILSLLVFTMLENKGWISEMESFFHD